MNTKWHSKSSGFETLEQHLAERIGNFARLKATTWVKPVIRPVRAREREYAGEFGIQIWTKRSLFDALLENLTVNPFDAGASVSDLLDFGDRQMFPFVKKYGCPILILRDHIQMRLECRPQLLRGRQFAVPDRLERRIELVGGTVNNFPEQFLFARDVRVQTATLHPQGFGKVAHTGGMVAQLREEFARSAVNLFFPGDGLGHVDTSLSDARAVLEINTAVFISVDAILDP
jgi:hypothetical protein